MVDWLLRRMVMAYDIEKERMEARQAGEAALRALRRAKQELNGARGWGIYDMLGGGMISTLIKHGKMDKARSYIEEAKWELQKFSKELRDVSYMGGADLGVSDLATFADFFFDGMLADFYVQTKINNARGQVDAAIRKVEMILSRL